MYTYVYMIHHHLQKPTTSANRSNCPAILVCLCLQQTVHHFGMSIFCSQKQGSCPRLCSKGIKLHTQKLSSSNLIMKEIDTLSLNKMLHFYFISMVGFGSYPFPGKPSKCIYRKPLRIHIRRLEKNYHSECSWSKSATGLLFIHWITWTALWE